MKFTYKIESADGKSDSWSVHVENGKEAWEMLKSYLRIARFFDRVLPYQVTLMGATAPMLISRVEDLKPIRTHNPVLN